MRSTFSRTFFPALLLLLSVLLVVGTFFQLTVRNYLNNQSLDRLENDAHAIAQLSSAYAADNSLTPRGFVVMLSVASEVSGADVVLFDGQGQLLLCSHNPFGCEHQGWQLSQDYLTRVQSHGLARDVGVFSSLYPDARYVVSLPILDAHTNAFLGMVTVSEPTASTEQILSRMQELFLIISLLAVLAALVVMTVYARRQSRPLRLMARTATDFGHGELDARVPTDSSYSTELEELALSFNNMADSLQKSEYQRREFVANVSHELKTPMTTISGYVDGILDGTIPADKHRQYLQTVSDETKRLSRLVRSMLDISRLQDQGAVPEEKKTRFELNELAGQVLIGFEHKILKKQLEVEVALPEHPVYVAAWQDQIHQVLYNLLDNAIKFCPQGGRLWLQLRQGGTKAYVTVSNEGRTIPAEELPLVFDRFHKLDKSRSQNRDGWGLGLYIVKTIICSHGEDISVTSGNGRTEFTFTLPLIP